MDPNNSLSQQWCFEPVDQEYYRVRNANSDKVLDVFSSSMDERAAVIQYRSGTTDSQKWSVRHGPDAGSVVIENRHSHSVLDLENHLQNAGAPIKQYLFHGGPNQRWILTPSNPNQGSMRAPFNLNQRLIHAPAQR
jgi:hypothetical protein